MWTADKAPTPDASGHDPHFAQRTAMWTAIGAAKEELKPGGTTMVAEAGGMLQGTLYATSDAYPSKSSPDRLAKSTVSFNATLDKSTPVVAVDVSAKRQTLMGFGGAITEAVASVFKQLSSDKQEEVGACEASL